MRKRAIFLTLFAALTACAAPSPKDNEMLVNGRGPLEQLPIIIAHRGASGERPEHTLAAYKLAIEQGADFIEPDLVLTKDGILVARHENEIGGTTNISEKPQFAVRKTTKIIDGQEYTGWFTEDFTLAELKTLRAKERLPQLRPDNMQYDGQYEIPTFEEILKLAKANKTKNGQRIGIYPETKHPSYFASIGLPHEKPLLEMLEKYGFNGAADPAYIQSFEIGNLKALRSKSSVKLIQLIADGGSPPDDSAKSYADMIAPAGLKDIATYANGIGLAKSLVKEAGPDEWQPNDRPLIRSAQKNGLLVHVWTFRRENYFLDGRFKSSDNPIAAGRLDDEIASYLAIGVNGIFSDNPKEAAEAAIMWESE